MGVDLSIFSNHKIKGITYEERIEDIENRLGNKIEILRNIPYKKENEPTKTDKAEDVIYYIDDDGRKYFDFDTFNEIQIQSNFEYFTGMRIFNKTLEMHMGLTSKYWRWLDYLEYEYYDTIESEYYVEYRQRWKSFKKFQIELLPKLGGDKVLYLDDTSFNALTDLLDKGKDLEVIISKLEKHAKLTELRTLSTDYESIFIKEEIPMVGLFEKIE